MVEKPGAEKSNPPERRRFLRESLTGSVPLLLGWLGGQVAQVARLIQQPEPLRRIAPPPAAKDSAPPPVKQKLDKHYEDFARENPSAPDYPIK